MKLIIIAINLIILSILILFEDIYSALIHSILFLALSFTLFNGLKQLIEEKELKEKEDKIIDFLFYCSMSGKNKTLIQLLKETKGKGFGLLEKEFMITLKQIEHGLSQRKALILLKKRNKSKVIERAIDLLLLGLKSGADLTELFRQTALDLMQTKQLIEERKAVMTIQKYTLVLASAIIIPIILAMITQLTQSFDFSLLSMITKTNNERKELIQASILAINVYLIEFAFLSAAFLSIIEKKKSSILLNGSIYSAIALSLFNIIKELKLI